MHNDYQRDPEHLGSVGVCRQRVPKVPCTANYLNYSSNAICKNKPKSSSLNWSDTKKMPQKTIRIQPIRPGKSHCLLLKYGMTRFSSYSIFHLFFLLYWQLSHLLLIKIFNTTMIQIRKGVQVIPLKYGWQYAVAVALVDRCDAGKGKKHVNAICFYPTTDNT